MKKKKIYQLRASKAKIVQENHFYLAIVKANYNHHNHKVFAEIYI